MILCEVQTRYSWILKYFEQYIEDHLSGTKVKIWIGSDYDAVFNFSCIASCSCLLQPNQDIHFVLHVIFFIRIRL